MQRNRQIFGICLSIFVVIFCLTPPFRNFVTFPSEMRLLEGELEHLSHIVPLHVDVTSSEPGLLRINGETLDAKTKFNLGSPLSFEPLGLGQVVLDLKLFGFIPFRKMVVDIVPQIHVVPGGHSIGVSLRADGMIVIGHTPIKGTDGRHHYPAREAGVNIGDVIIAVNDQNVQDVDEAGDLIEDACVGGKPIILKIRRNNEITDITVQPELDADARLYRIGIFIRDSAAGVGTLTFYDPETMVYGALGHVIADMDTNQPIAVGEGRVARAIVTSIEKGRKAQPGEKRGRDNGEAVGNIEINNHYGIFGTLSENLDNEQLPGPIPIALNSQVKEGFAEILTVIEGEQIERFSIEIQRVFRQTTPDTKGMIIKITDPRLLEATGGIVQGMSGSPIIQNGRLVGAVTHVYVNDPTRGYGIFAEWMVRESGTLERRLAKQTLSQATGYPVAVFFC